MLLSRFNRLVESCDRKLRAGPVAGRSEPEVFGSGSDRHQDRLSRVSVVTYVTLLGWMIPCTVVGLKSDGSLGMTCPFITDIGPWQCGQLA